MPLSWNEIKSRATAFSKEWEDETNEGAESQSFWNDFFNVFGISRRRVATFEKYVKKIDETGGFIDLLWKGVILIEHKSKGKDLVKAYGQAKDYFPGLKEKELPRYILVSDFARFRLYDLEDDTSIEFVLNDFINNIHLFGFIAGYHKRIYKEQDPVNIEAAELMGVLHDKLKFIGYSGHSLELYLVRLLFCLFADDTNIFEKDIFNDYLELKTNPDGSDLAMHLDALFLVLNTDVPNRLTNLDESLAAFPFVNGKLFEERLPLASFDSKMRLILLECCLLDWGKISPAIFGSLFQSVMNEKSRRNLGAHYTSEKNILKVIKPLFLDNLWKEFESAKLDRRKLQRLHDKITRMHFMDPACGCGNFLIIAYREVRILELEIVKVLLSNQRVTSINDYFLIDVDQFYGIEYEEFPCQIAQVAMWLIDHQMNMIASVMFGPYYKRIPLKKSALITKGNALRTDWSTLIDSKGVETFDFIFGNPPFVGHQWRNAEQMKDMEIVFGDTKRAGRLDYVAAWYIKAAEYLQVANKKRAEEEKIAVAFVSTSSISQGEQVSILWKELFFKYRIKIHFAHRTFKWTNEARGNAGVHVVIIGFADFDVQNKKIFEYEDIKGEPHEIKVQNINPYLTEGKDLFIESRGRPLHQFPELYKGSQPTDGGHLVLSEIEKDDLVKLEPGAAIWIKPYIGADEYLYSIHRYCLWLKGITPHQLKGLKQVMSRVELVKESRLRSPTFSVREFAQFPTLFTQDRQPDSSYLVIPEVSSENRVYIPIGFLEPQIICSNKLQIIPDATLYMFGILQSMMHMVWTKYVCGRLESRISYSPSVYNNFPWPRLPTDEQVSAIERAAQSILDIRNKYTTSNLAELYDPLTMPPALVKAHQVLDRLVDLSYRPQAFQSEMRRIEFLFDAYDRLAMGMFVKQKKGKRGK